MDLDLEVKIWALPPGYQPPGGRFLVRMVAAPADAASPAPPPDYAPPLQRVSDARPMQAMSESAAEFFAIHGFALLPAPTQLRHMPLDPAERADQVARTYYDETRALVRDLLPGRRLEIAHHPGVLRGRGALDAYAFGAHQDYALTADDFDTNDEAWSDPATARAWRESYERESVEGFMVINFWRPVNMQAPLRHMPLAVCDPNSVVGEDLVSHGVLDTPSGKPSTQLSLRYNPAHRWYYYPNMTCDEVLAFHNFQCMKDDVQPVLRSCFHSAFEDPTAPAGTEPRMSYEHRVMIYLLR